MGSLQPHLPKKAKQHEVVDIVWAKADLRIWGHVFGTQLFLNRDLVDDACILAHIAVLEPASRPAPEPAPKPPAKGDRAKIRGMSKHSRCEIA